MATKPNYYSNPAFCQQSEFYNQQRAFSPSRNARQSPVGAQTYHQVVDTSICDDPENHESGIKEQEFYEEVLVDDKGFITDKKFVVVAQTNEGKKYIQTPQEEQQIRYKSTQNMRYESPPRPTANKQRYEYLPMQEKDIRVVAQKKLQFQSEQREVRVHRYAVIDAEEETELTTKNGRYALVPVEDLDALTTNKNPTRYEYIQEPPKATKDRYEYVHNTPQNTPPKQRSRYEYVQQNTPPSNSQQVVRYAQNLSPTRQPQQRTGNPAATQKLHELLSTPKRPRKPSEVVLSPQSSRRIVEPPLSPIPKDPFQTPKTSPKKYAQNTPKSHQKLNYAIGARQLVQDKRHTAIVAPLCSSPIQSVYSETTYSKSGSWMNLSTNRTPVQAGLSLAAGLMLLCGGVTSGLCFYMISFLGRLYYLDFGVVSGFTCLILGMLGFRSRNVYWLPNRNYISGYLVLSIFSLLTCAGLLVLLVMQPKPGSPLADMTSGAVCGVSVFTLGLAATGVVSSYCCKYPPPDNRVQHCSPGFTV